MITSCAHPQMIGPGAGGSERGLKREGDPEALFAMCLHPDSQSDLSTALSCCSSLLLYSLHVSQFLQYILTLQRAKDDLSLPGCSEFNHIKTATINIISSEEGNCVLKEACGRRGSFLTNTESLGSLGS